MITKEKAPLRIGSNFFNCQVRNKDLAEDFDQISTYENILGSGKFSEVRKLRHKHTKRVYAVRTFRLPVMQLFDKANAYDIEKKMIWDQIKLLR